jgi:hypothetical protein
VGDASCAMIVEFDGRTYIGSGVSVSPREGDAIGSGVMLGCDDGNGASADEAIQLAEIEGVSPQIAVAWRGNGDTVFIAEGVDPFPPELQELTNAPVCVAADAPIALAGPWLGITASDGRTETNLQPPYDIEMFVEETSSPRYERAYLMVRVPQKLGQPLTEDDLRGSLWEGGTVEVSARCEGDLYLAESIEAHPPD